MVKPEPCEDCKEDQERVLARAAKGRNSVGTTTMCIMTTAKDYMEDRGSGLRTGFPRLLLHQTEKADKVELWRSHKKSSSTGREARMAVPIGTWNGNGNGNGNGTMGGMTTATAATVPVGGELGRMATFQGLSSTDRQKVCGFHMHALEWHHMQTVGLDEILATARQAKCDVFNFSVVRWLGNKVKTSVANSSNNTSPSSIANNTGLPASFPFSRTTHVAPNKSNSSTGLGLKLFHKISCDCGAEAVIAKGPTIASPYRPLSKEKQFLVVCRGRAFTDPQYEIVDPSPNGNFYAYHDHDRSRLGLLGAKIPKCKFSISIDIAIFWSHHAPIHSRIKNNEWLAQRLSPPLSSGKKLSSRSPSLPISKSSRSSRLSSSRPVSASSPISRLPFGSTGVSVSSSSPRLSDLMVSSIQRSLTLGETSTRRSSGTTTLAHTKSSAIPIIPAEAPPSRLLTVRDFGTLEHGPSILPNGELMQKQQGPQDGTRKTNGASRLIRLDKELEETVAWHVAEVTSIMEDAAQDHWSSLMPDDSDAPAWQQYSNYNEIDMTEYPGIAMHLCQWCKDNARDFCVVPSLKNQPDLPSLTSPGRTSSMTGNNPRTGATTGWSIPPSPPQSPDGLMDAIESYNDRDTATADTCTELERVDRKLERVMLRHAMEVQEAMESRSRLFPSLLICRGCELRTTTTTTRVSGGGSGSRDVLPCCHAILCIDCVETVEFYLVPRTTTATGRSTSGYGPGYGLYE
ncbi:hypothetical protein EC957_002046 [Mortierella hygrophila]|uniref:Uncharacterized protein n=1 Tax=Mortierella hygrophila TaxID=979708 RepID=A0A9P6FH14_9FUNG|nr:hypothetical protein EC957_002046 [Mortierella hygrophila]